MAVTPEYIPDPEIGRTNLVAGKVAIVTGASRGIGRAIAEALAYHGTRAVAINSTPNSEQQAVETLEVIKSYGAEGIWIPGGIDDPAIVEKLVEETIDNFGNINILVNNAGITRDNSLADMSIKELNEVMKVNTIAPILVTKYALDYLQADKGVVIFMSSAAAHGNPGQAAYSSSKGAVESFTRTMTAENGILGLRFNAVAPGLVDTRMAAGLNSEVREYLIGQTPIQRIISSSEIADVVVWLASPMARIINGQVLHADGGMLRL